MIKQAQIKTHENIKLLKSSLFNVKDKTILEVENDLLTYKPSDLITIKTSKGTKLLIVDTIENKIININNQNKLLRIFNCKLI